MKIGIISTAVPLINGGGRFIVEWLADQIRAQGHECEIVYIPFSDVPQHILTQMAAIRMMKLDDYFDRVITLRPPAHMVQHPNKVVWLLHHLRIFYDLWQTEYCVMPDDAAHQALRAAIMGADNLALGEARRVYAISGVVAGRIKQFNGINSEVLYPPVLLSEKFLSGDCYGDEIVSVSRIEHHKRQHLLIEALACTTTPVRLRLCGKSESVEYLRDLQALAADLGVTNRLTLDARWISETEKVAVLSCALASAYAPVDEDYGYPTVEAAHAKRCTITAEDAGGVAELVVNEVTGFVTQPTAEGLAAAFDKLFLDRALARDLGKSACERVTALGINWPAVVEQLLA